MSFIRSMNGKSVTPGMGAKFLHLNRNKRSLVLDLKKPEAHAALLKLIAGADVLVWNVRPAAMARLKLSYEDVKKVKPDIIYVGMFGFGQDGRYAEKPAYDTIIQGSGGMAALNHRATGEPRFVPMVVADKVVGLIATQMISMALYRKDVDLVKSFDDPYPYFRGLIAEIGLPTVKLLYDDGTSDAISGDVKAGDRVVTDGQLRVVPGQPVCIGRCAPAQSGGDRGNNGQGTGP